MAAMVKRGFRGSILGMIAVCALPLAAHDLYLVTAVSGAQGRICARVGEHFPESMSGVSADRVEAFRLHAPSGATALDGKAEAAQYCAELTPGGSAVAEMVVRPRFIELPAGDFNSYLRGEGLTAVMRLRRQRGQEQAPGKELYSRYAKLLVGELGGRAARPLGMVLEIVPEQDPAQLRPPQEWTVRIMFRGQPLAHAQVAAVYAGAELKGHEYPVTTRTDAEGRAKLKIDRAGWWYARLIHMIPAENEPGADWRSFFGTLVFHVPAGK